MMNNWLYTTPVIDPMGLNDYARLRRCTPVASAPKADTDLFTC